MQILNKNVNVRDDICFRISSNGKICELSKEQVESIIASFEELRKDNKSISNIEDLGKANTLAREKRLVRVRNLEDEQRMRQNAGFALVGSVTTIGILAMGLLIFMAIKLMILG